MIRNVIQKALLVIIIFSSLRQLVIHLASTKELGDLSQDPVAAWENRFIRLKKALPAEVKSVGYLADWDVAGISWEAGDQYGEYVLLQYTLAPIIATRGIEQEWIVGNLTPQAYDTWKKTTEEGDFEVSYFRGNLYLIHKLTP